MENYLELLRKELKNILNELMEKSDDIINDMSNNTVETNIKIELSCETLPNYTISTKKLSSKVMESLNEKKEKYES